MLYDDEIEDFIYEEIKKQYCFIEKYSKKFEVDPRLIVGLIYVERAQYKLDPVRNLAKKLKLKFEAIARDFCNDSDDISEFFNTSKGFAHIKFDTARHLVRKYKKAGILTDLELGTYPDNIEISIKFSCAVIKEHILMWAEKVPDIKNRIDILATLYNISDFKNKIPHANPKSGGSVLPVIIDGQYIDGLCFGDRVKKVCLSGKMDDFFKSI